MAVDTIGSISSSFEMSFFNIFVTRLMIEVAILIPSSPEKERGSCMREIPAKTKGRNEALGQ